MAGSSSNNQWIVPALVSSGLSVTAIVGGYWAFQQHEKYLRSKWLDEEDQRQQQSTAMPAHPAADAIKVGKSLSGNLEGYRIAIPTIVDLRSDCAFPAALWGSSSIYYE